MSLLNYFFPHIYGSDASKELERVNKLCEDLIDEYKTNDNMVHTSSKISASPLEDVTLTSASSQIWEQGYLNYVMENASTTCAKSEFISYLEDDILFDKEKIEIFSILGW